MEHQGLARLPYRTQPPERTLHVTGVFRVTGVFQSARETKRALQP